MHVRPISAAETRPIRQKVLRPTQTAEELVFPGDDEPTAGHFGAFVGHDLVGVASVYEQGETGQTEAGLWRLRGMAVLPEYRGRGLGVRLFEATADHAIVHGGSTYWCTARVTARDFYLARGMHQVGDEFELPTIGPHVIMRMALLPLGAPDL